MFFKVSVFGSKFPRKGKKKKKKGDGGGTKKQPEEGEQESACSSKASASINVVQGGESSAPSHIVSQANALQRIPLRQATGAPACAPTRTGRPSTRGGCAGGASAQAVVEKELSERGSPIAGQETRRHLARGSV